MKPDIAANRTPEQIQKAAAARHNGTFQFSDETRRKMSESAKRRWERMQEQEPTNN